MEKRKFDTNFLDVILDSYKDIPEPINTEWLESLMEAIKAVMFKYVLLECETIFPINTSEELVLTVIYQRSSYLIEKCMYLNEGLYPKVAKSPIRSGERESNIINAGMGETQPLNAIIGSITSPTSKSKTQSEGSGKWIEERPEDYINIYKAEMEYKIDIVKSIKDAYLPLLDFATTI